MISSLHQIYWREQTEEGKTDETYITRMSEINACRIFMEKLYGRDYLEDKGVDRRIILKKQGARI